MGRLALAMRRRRQRMGVELESHLDRGYRDKRAIRMRNTADGYGDVLYTGLLMESGILFASSLIPLVCLMNGDDASKLQPISVSFLKLERSFSIRVQVCLKCARGCT